jgi:hypothetical protein
MPSDSDSNSGSDSDPSAGATGNFFDAKLKGKKVQGQGS